MQMQHRRNDGEAVVDPVVYFLDQQLLAIERLAEISFHALSFDRHAQDVGDTLQKDDIALGEFAFRPAIDLEHSVWLPISLQDHVHGTPDAVLHQEFGRAKALFDIQMVGDDRLAGVQRVSGRGRHVGADGGLTNNFGTPANSRANQEPIFFGQVLQDFAELRLQSLGGQASGMASS